jgi:CHAD domain-containing protein
MEDGMAWVQRGPWRNAPASASARAIPISTYASRRLKRWRRRIIRRRDELAAMDAKTRHRLRIRTKRARYATEWFGEFLPHGSSRRHRAMVKQLRLAQNSLGELNDAERAKALVAGLPREAGSQLSDAKKSDAKQNKRLLRAAIAAFDTLAQLDKAN